MSGFRNTVDKVAPELRARRDLRYTLLDDVPVATLISGHALAASGVLGKASTGGYLPVADQCAGFVTGGLLMSSFARDEPTVVTGPTAPDLRDPADPWCWHDMAELPVHGMRRCRRLDVSPVDDGRTVLIDAMFRDTYERADGVETIIHEYTLDAAVEPVSGVILRSEATPRVLPWQECPGASPARAGSPACDSTSCTAECATNCTAPRPAPTSTTCCAASPTPQPLSLSCPPNSTRTEEQCRFR
ncbi:hypothetical protein C731_4843 [Mycolicibacterium hassiacum DSM 44199]|jgi:hypothetical protein|uniref:Uncharacterized protein n=1 Tax=Mycolicibacterium hassiacum (strain DSM 44199 / CIP 105218 / JCM 12690 / 3849) TaxID=1122247 RepID=K5B9V3_MYCHD|nr:hypothetical protein C731_4843 [Mycolicibacterium hassiacum DSM 44199]MDA4086364.1 hypothetical protein [Mycolicibacterium hassiacum DSM 44199]VCT91339.1 hypothetical protein MHAS_03053 [Mycolicibacterium hassiacum DSM 44199]